MAVSAQPKRGTARPDIRECVEGPSDDTTRVEGPRIDVHDSFEQRNCRLPLFINRANKSRLLLRNLLSEQRSREQNDGKNKKQVPMRSAQEAHLSSHWTLITDRPLICG
jgi:hypothetical protein